MGVASPVIAFLGEQLFELAQGDEPPSDRRPVRDQLLAEVVRHGDVVTRRLLRGSVSANGKKEGNLSTSSHYLITVTRK